MSDNQKLLEKMKNLVTEYCQSNFNFDFDPAHPKVRLQETTYNGEEIFAAVETLLSTYTTMGKKVRSFEQQYADFIGTQYSVMSNSGSSANLLAVAALANPFTKNYLRPGDEVIVPALSWSTTIWPLVQCGLLPVFVDCSLQDFNLDIQKLEQAITPKTRAIKLVHVYGNPCNMDAIMALAKKHQLFVIEDCCEAMGAQYDGKSVGTFGQVGNFSFFFSHHITTLEGGISVSNDFDFTETLRILRAHGWSREADEHQKYVNRYPHIDPRFIFINQGYNLRPTELNAAMGAIQLPKLNDYNENRRKAAHYFLEKLQPFSEFFHFQQETPKGRHVWFGFPLVIKENAPFSVQEITAYLKQNGIETRPIIAGNMTRHPGVQMYPHRIAGELNAADTIMQKGFAFACHHALSKAACQYIIDVITQFIKEASQHQAGEKVV